jgi:6-phosphogluconolactonase
MSGYIFRSGIKVGGIMSATTKYKPNIEVVSDPESLARRNVEIFIADAQKAVDARGVFCVAISGGHTPRRFFELLGEMSQECSLPWDRTHLFWVDERIVSADSVLSNYKLAADTFLAKVPIPKQNIHRIPTEYEDFE